jgi:hypothetical protein
MKSNRDRNKTKHNFLHTFFPHPTGYQEIEINGYILINQLTTRQEWEVAIFTKETFQKRKSFLLNPKQENNLFG